MKNGKKKKTTTTIPSRIFAQASPHSLGGVSMFAAQDQIRSQNVENFYSEQEMITRAIFRLRDAGFEVLQASQASINIAGPIEVYQKAFNTKIISQERPVIKQFGQETTATFFDSPDTELSGLIATEGTHFEDVLEGVAIEEPRYLMGPSMFAPLKSYWHLRLPGDVSLAGNADRAHRTGITGKGIKVAMVDSGWYKHPYFVGRGYRAAPVVLAPGSINPLADEVGHGTGESANIFALAPDVELLPVKWNFANSVAGFNAAVALSPHIITCSWGSNTMNGPLSAADQAMAAAISAAVAAGITVIFSAGNGHWGFPGQHPDVISAGGVFMNQDESLQASNYASGFMSRIYPGRRVPDLCGLVGMKPKAAYLMLPLEPGDNIDVGNAGGTHPNGDETANNDGWAAFSGTSAAAPQLAGAAALIKQACSKLKPADIKDILIKTARDVTAGRCGEVVPADAPAGNGGHPAAVGPDTATGHGLVDAHKAVLLAKVRCLGTIVKPGPIAPGPITPQPQPVVKPIQPIQPQPIQPQPIQPKPIQPAPVNPGPIAPKPQPGPPPVTRPAAMGEAPQEQLSQEDIQALEDLIVNVGLE